MKLTRSLSLVALLAGACLALAACAQAPELMQPIVQGASAAAFDLHAAALAFFGLGGVPVPQIVGDGLALMPSGLSPDILATGLVLNPSTFKAVEQGFKASFAAGLKRQKPNHDAIAMTVPSSTAENIYSWLADNFQIREWVGERYIQNLSVYDYAIKNKDFEGTVSVESNKIKDDQYGIYSKLFEQMGDSVTMFPDSLIYKALKAGATTLCYDGQYFFDTDHPVGLPGKEVSVSNHLGGSGDAWYLLDTSKVLRPMIWQPREAFQMVMKDRPTDDNVFFQKKFIYGVDGRCNVGYGLWQLAFMSKQTLDSTNLKAALTAMGNQKGNNGEPLDVTGDTLVVGAALYETAMDLNGKDVLANGESNTLRGRFKVIKSGWL